MKFILPSFGDQVDRWGGSLYGTTLSPEYFLQVMKHVPPEVREAKNPLVVIQKNRLKKDTILKRIGKEAEPMFDCPSGTNLQAVGPAIYVLQNVQLIEVKLEAISLRFLKELAKKGQSLLTPSGSLAALLMLTYKQVKDLKQEVNLYQVMPRTEVCISDNGRAFQKLLSLPALPLYPPSPDASAHFLVCGRTWYYDPLVASASEAVQRELCFS